MICALIRGRCTPLRLWFRRCEPFPWPHLRMLSNPATHCAADMASDPYEPVRCRAAA
jgi:hypothetical protein